MTYDARELSTFGGGDIRLYEFRMGTVSWRYATGDRAVSFDGQTWLAGPINDGGLKQKGQATSDDFVVTMPTSYAIPKLFRGTPPSQPIKLIMRQIQYGDTVDAPIMWLGYVSSVTNGKDDVTSEVLCNSQTAYLHRKGNRNTYERECPHALYDSECRVDKALWAERVTILSMSGTNIVYAHLDPPLSDDRDSRFTNGFCEWVPLVNGLPAGYTERRGIMYHSNFIAGQRVVILLGQTDGLDIGQTITFYPGCDRSPANCVLFNNISNYGGFAYMNSISPFDGNPVF